MRRIQILGLGLAAGVGILTACSDELPTSLGSDLIGGGFRTFAVVLEASEFLQSDTTFDQLGTLNDASFALVAESFEGELFAHTLFRINRPTQVSFQDDEGATVTDTVFTIIGGTVTVVLDSLGEETGPIELEVMEVTESWDPGSVTWEQRFDTAGVATEWAEPGGTTDRRLGGELSEEGDTLRIALDSAAAAVWTDSASAFHGGLIRTATQGARARIQELSFEFNVRPESADTVVGVGSAGVRAVVATPDASEPAAGELRVGGLPAWRTALQFHPLGDIRIPCVPGSTTCTISLSEAELSVATLLLQPLPVGSRRIERPFRAEARAILRAPGVPVTRSPLSVAFGSMAEPMDPAEFSLEAAPGAVAAVPITGYIQRNLNPLDGEDTLLWAALMSENEQGAPLFGYAAFGSTRSATPPQLRLVVTVPTEEVRP